MSVLVYDATVKFCDRFIDSNSRTHDQMVQAARSGNKNISEGSQVSGTSKKMELKLVGVARASLEELLGDYKDLSAGWLSGARTIRCPASCGAWLTPKIGPIRPIRALWKMLLQKSQPIRCSA